MHPVNARRKFLNFLAASPLVATPAVASSIASLAPAAPLPASTRQGRAAITTAQFDSLKFPRGSQRRFASADDLRMSRRLPS